MDTATLVEWVRDARRHTLDLVSDLDDSKLAGTQMPGRSPLRWEIGHVAWYQERWVLRHGAGRPALNPASDTVYDSDRTRPEERWTLPLYSRESSFHYLEEVRDAVVDRLRYGRPTPADRHLATLSVLHEDRHSEDILALRQEMGYAAPRLRESAFSLTTPAGPLPGDVSLPGGIFMLGATPDDACVWEDEKWAHPVRIAPFSLSRAPVTQAEFAAFVEDSGYERQELWTVNGWRWRNGAERVHPRYWRKMTGVGWQRRMFDRWVALEPNRPMIHVNWYEADAFCRWAGRRLPTEKEWEYAASWDPATGRKRRAPWGEEPAAAKYACLEATGAGIPDVGGLAAGEAPSGCRQMLGSVWEWTASQYAPYPGYEGPTLTSTQGCNPFFRRMSLRGGSWATRSRLARNTLRLGLEPERDDYWTGFRTCPL